MRDGIEGIDWYELARKLGGEHSSSPAAERPHILHTQGSAILEWEYVACARTGDTCDQCRPVLSGRANLRRAAP